MGNCSSKDGVREDGPAPLPQPAENASIVSPKAPTTPTVSPNKPVVVLKTSTPLKDWSTHDIQLWLRTLPGHLVCYSPILMGPGIKVVEWNDEVLTELGVKTPAHRQELLKQKQQLLVEISSMLTADQKPWQPTDAAAAAALSKDELLLRSSKVLVTSSTEGALQSKRSATFSVPTPASNGSRSLSPAPSAQHSLANDLGDVAILSPSRSRGTEDGEGRPARSPEDGGLLARLKSLESSGPDAMGLNLSGARDLEGDRSRQRSFSNGEGPRRVMSSERLSPRWDSGRDVGREVGRESSFDGRPSPGRDSERDLYSSRPAPGERLSPSRDRDTYSGQWPASGRSQNLDDGMELSSSRGAAGRGYSKDGPGARSRGSRSSRGDYDAEETGGWEGRGNGSSGNGGGYDVGGRYRELDGGLERRGSGPGLVEQSSGSSPRHHARADRASPEPHERRDRLSSGSRDLRDKYSPEQRDRRDKEREHRDMISPERRDRDRIERERLSPEQRDRDRRDRGRLSPELRDPHDPDRPSPGQRERRARLSPEPHEAYLAAEREERDRRDRRDHLSPEAQDRLNQLPADPPIPSSHQSQQRMSPEPRISPEAQRRPSPGPHVRDNPRNQDDPSRTSPSGSFHSAGWQPSSESFRNPLAAGWPLDDAQSMRSGPPSSNSLGAMNGVGNGMNGPMNGPMNGMRGSMSGMNGSMSGLKGLMGGMNGSMNGDMSGTMGMNGMHNVNGSMGGMSGTTNTNPGMGSMNSSMNGMNTLNGVNGMNVADMRRSPTRGMSFEPARSSVGLGFDQDNGITDFVPAAPPLRSRSFGEVGLGAADLGSLGDLGSGNMGGLAGPRNRDSRDEWNDAGLEGLERSAPYPRGPDLTVVAASAGPLPSNAGLSSLGYLHSQQGPGLGGLPDLGNSASNAAQLLGSSAARGQAVRLLNLVENSRQRWDEESRHVEALLRHAADALPSPGAQLSARLRSMYHQLDLLMLNQIHYRKMFERALAVLALMCEVLSCSPITRSTWRSFASRLDDTLMAVEEYMSPVAGKSWLGVLVTGGWSSELMCLWWRQLAELGMELAGDTSSRNPGVEECLSRFNLSCKFDDESSKMKNLISALGGIAVVMGEPKKTLELCAMLNTRKRHQKLTVNQVLQAALMMECTVESGPHSIISNDIMRMMWYRCFPARHAVSWAEFWKVFPLVLPDLGVDMGEVEGLNMLFKDVQRRHHLQQRISNGNAVGLSVFNVHEAFPKNVSLQEACTVASDESRNAQDHVIHQSVAGLYGREEDLPVLMTSLLEVWRPGVITLQGDAGRGKSSLLQEVANRLRRIHCPAGGIFLVDMHKAASANELAARVCAAVGAVLDNEDKTAMWVALQRLSGVGPLLLVLEDVTAAVSNVDGKQALVNLITQVLSKAPNTRILITSSVSVELPGVQVERHILGPLSKDGALALLLASVPELDQDIALHLAATCRHQPLSLNLAAACLAHGHCSTQDIAKMQAEHSGPNSVNSPEAGVLPAVLSVLPQPLVEALTHLVIFPQQFDDRAAALVLRRDVPDTRGLLAALCARHLLKLHKPSGMFRMHPAIREVATKQLCPSGYPHPAISGFLVNCLEMLRTAGSLYAQCHCAVALQWVNLQRQNLLGLLNLLNSGVLSETLVNQVDDLAQGMEVMSALDIGSARTFAKMWYILSIGVERVLTPTHPNLATVLSCRADVLAKMQHHVEAEKLYKQAMHIISKVPGGAEPQFATVLEKLGMLLSKQGSFEHASHHLRRALNIKQRILGDDSMEVAEARIKLASVLSQKETDSEEAEQLLTDGYATMVADVAQGNHHPRVIEPFTNLASSYMAQDLPGEAERMYRCVLEVQEDLFEKMDPRLVGTLRKLASACASQSKFDEAEALYKRALAIQHHYYGQGQLESVPVMNKLAAIYSQQGQYEEAEAIFNKALAIQRAQQGDSHADLAPTLCELGDLLCKQSKWGKAEAAYKEALQVLKAVSAEEKIFARVLVRLATAVEAQERPAEAQALYEQLVVLQRKVVGENSQQVADAYQKMGGVMHQQGDTVQAQAMTEKSVAILQQLVGDTPRLAEALKVLGMQMSGNGFHEEAEQRLRHAITIETHAYGPNNLRLTDGLLRLAEVMQKLGKLNDAEEATCWVIDINLQGATPSECNNPGIAKLYINLASIQQAQGKLADAVLSLQRALAIYDRLVARLVAQPAAWRTDELVIKIADLLSENGQYGQAEGYYARAVSEQEATQGSGSLELATSVFKLALAQSAQSKHSEAEQLYRRALHIRQHQLGSGDPDLLPVLSGLAMARGAQGDLPSAESLYFQALEIIEAHDGMVHPDAANVIDHLHETLERQGKITELGRLYTRVRQLKPANSRSQAVVTKLLDSSKKYNLDVGNSIDQTVD